MKQICSFFLVNSKIIGIEIYIYYIYIDINVYVIIYDIYICISTSHSHSKFVTSTLLANKAILLYLRIVLMGCSWTLHLRPMEKNVGLNCKSG